MGIPRPSLLLSDEDKERVLSLPSPKDCTSVQRDDLQHLAPALEVDEKTWKSEYQQVVKAKVIGLIKRKTHEINQLKLSAREKKRRIEQMSKKQKARHPDLFKREKVKK